MIQQTYISPSGLQFILREQTGADDDKISRASLNDAEVINKYVSNVIVEGPGGKPLSVEEVKELRLGDKYFLVVASRILSLGPTLYFQYTWDKARGAVEYDVDLNQFIWDYAKPFPKIGEEGYDESRIAPYEPVESLEFRITSGKQFRFKYLDGVGELWLLGLKDTEYSINKELIARGLQMWENDKWINVLNFAPLTAREMVEIRHKVNILDPPITGNMDITDPSTGQTITLSILSLRDFFYPVKV